MGFGVWGVGCGVWGVGCGVWGVGCGMWVVGCGVKVVGCGVWDAGCGVWGQVTPRFLLRPSYLKMRGCSESAYLFWGLGMFTSRFLFHEYTTHKNWDAFLPMSGYRRAGSFFFIGIPTCGIPCHDSRRVAASVATLLLFEELTPSGVTRVVNLTPAYPYVIAWDQGDARMGWSSLTAWQLPSRLRSTWAPAPSPRAP